MPQALAALVNDGEPASVSATQYPDRSLSGTVTRHPDALAHKNGSSANARRSLTRCGEKVLRIGNGHRPLVILSQTTLKAWVHQVSTPRLRETERGTLLGGRKQKREHIDLQVGGSPNFISIAPMAAG